jgi:hypothetical protein
MSKEIDFRFNVPGKFAEILLRAAISLTCGQKQAQPDTTSHCYCSRPNSATPLGVPTKTLPFATIGVMNLLPLPN